MALTTNLVARVRAVLTGTADHAVPQASVELVKAVALASGSGASQANLLFSDKRTLAASASEELDLYGALLDLLGSTLNFAKVKGLLIVADPGNTNNVVVGNAASAQVQLGFGAVAHTWAIPPGGWMFVGAPVNGWTVTDSSADTLKIANSGGSTSVTYDIVIVGAS